MLFVLDSSLSSYAFQVVPQSVLTGLDTLAVGFREGKHIIAGPLITLNALLRIENLQPSTKIALKSVREQFPQLMALPGQYNCYALIMPDNAGGLRRTVVAGKHVLEIPISHFSDSSKIQKTVILGENIKDADVAILMAEFYRSQSQYLKSVPIRPDSRSGGGSNLIDTYERLRNAHECFTVTIVDSDKKCPNCAMGNTAKAILQTHSDHGNSPMMEVIILNCHEMENALPDAFYEEAFLAGVEHNDSVNFLKQLSDTGEFDIRHFIDIKAGISLGQILTMPKNSPKTDFWNAKLSVLRSLSAYTQQHDTDCTNHDVCKNPGDCRCWFLKPNGTDILGKAVEIIPKFKAEQRRSFGTHCSRTWFSIGRVVFEWCSGWKFSSA
jgi:hypothetical protein